MQKKILISLFSLVGLAAVGFAGYYTLGKISADANTTAGSSTGIIVKVVDKDSIEEPIEGATVGVIFANRSANSVLQAFWNPIHDDVDNFQRYLAEDSFATGVSVPLNANTKQDLFNTVSTTDDIGLDWFVNRMVPAGNCDAKYAPCFGRDAGFIIWTKSDGGTNSAGLTPNISTTMFTTEIRRIAESTNWAPIKIFVNYNGTTTVKNLVGIGGFLADAIKVGQINNITIKIPKTSVDNVEADPGISIKVMNFQNQPVEGAKVKLEAFCNGESYGDSKIKIIATDNSGEVKLSSSDSITQLGPCNGTRVDGAGDSIVVPISPVISATTSYGKNIVAGARVFDVNSIKTNRSSHLIFIDTTPKN